MKHMNACTLYMHMPHTYNMKFGVLTRATKIDRTQIDKKNRIYSSIPVMLHGFVNIMGNTLTGARSKKP